VAGSSVRFSPLFRWLGLTLVILLGLQMLAVLSLGSWGEEPFRQLVVERFVSQAPMALVGLLLMLVGSRLDDPETPRTPIRWTVCVLSGLLALGLLASLPVAFGGDQMMEQEVNQQLAAKRGQLAMARQQSKDPRLPAQLIQQAEAAGQLPAGSTAAQKQEFVKGLIDRQLQQIETQVKQAEQTSRIGLNQRRYGGSGGAVLLLVAFTLLAFASVL